MITFPYNLQHKINGNLRPNNYQFRSNYYQKTTDHHMKTARIHKKKKRRIKKEVAPVSFFKKSTVYNEKNY